MIILHFDLQPQFEYMNYFIYTSHHLTNFIPTVIGPNLTSCHVKLIFVAPLGSKTRKLGARWKMRVRDPGVWKIRGVVENTGCGKHRVWWKTRGLSAKHGGAIFSPNNEVEILLFQIAMKINRRKTRFFVHKRGLNISLERNHLNANVPCSGFLLHWAPIFRSKLRVFFSFEKEIMK